MTKQVYLFIGPPGSGKGSLSKLCSLNMGWQQFSTGNLCRKHISEQTPIGKEIDFIIKSGKLISDDLVSAMVDDWLASSIDRASSFILDGFPRNSAQVKSLLEMLKNKYTSLKLKVVRFVISDTVAVDRICNRFICKNSECQTVYSGNEQSGLTPKRAMLCDYCSGELVRRVDDSRETVEGRLAMYRSFERKMLDFLADYDCIEVNVERPLHEIFETFKSSINTV